MAWLVGSKVLLPPSLATASPGENSAPFTSRHAPVRQAKVEQWRGEEALVRRWEQELSWGPACPRPHQASASAP